jgi:hypothetical protein
MYVMLYNKIIIIIVIIIIIQFLTCKLKMAEKVKKYVGIHKYKNAQV